MPLFFDSNVILGFCFTEVDKWGPEADAIMHTSDIKYISDNVMKECFGDDEHPGKASKKLTELRQQVREFCDCHPCPDCEPDLKNFSMIAKPVRKFKEQGKSRNEIIDCVRTLQYNVETAYYQNKAKLSGQLNLHTREKEYDELHKQLESKIRDPDDLKIILDAHDLALTIKELILVTGDRKHIVAAKDIICHNTEICDVQYLKEYTPAG